MHTDCVPSNALKVLDQLRDIIHTHRFTLAGGTALALQYGHRISVDLDFFSEHPFSTEKLYQEMKGGGLEPEIIHEEEGTLTSMIEGVKVSMLHYPYPFLEKEETLRDVPVAGILDIASMKVIDISQRGARRDFVDLYFVLLDTPFWKIAGNMVKRYGAKRINPVNIGKSLVYFNDAEGDPDPQYRGDVRPDWESIKKFFKSRVRQIVLDIEETVTSTG